MRATASASRYKVQVLDRSFRIIDALADSQADLSPTDIATRLRIHKSTIHRLLAVLAEERFVRRSPDGKYGLGMKFVELGSRATERLDLGAHALPYLEQLVGNVGETAHISVLSGSEMVSVANVPGTWTLRMPATVGRRAPIHCTAIGKALIAFLDADEVTRLLASSRLARYTRRTITSASALRSVLQHVRRRGFAIDDEEIEEGLRCIGAPIRNYTGGVVASISIAGPVFRVRKSRIAEISRAVMKTADELSADLGYVKLVTPKAGIK